MIAFTKDNERMNAMFAIIVNPVSGRRADAQLTDKLCEEIKARGCSVRVFPTECKGDATTKARQALSEGYTSIVGVGGDGTLSEIVEGMGGSDATLYIVPCGTGNDFARAFGLPKDPLEAFRAQLNGERHAYDCLTINGRPFLNIGGSGFDVEVLRKTEELKAVYPGEKAYTKAVLEMLTKYKPHEIEMTVDGEAPEIVRCTIIEMANGRFFGGGMLVAPGSVADDGLIDVVVVDSVPRWAIPFLLPLFAKGWHVHLPICHVRRAKHVVLRAQGMTINIDGRLESMDEAEFGIIPGGLMMMRPVNP